MIFTEYFGKLVEKQGRKAQGLFHLDGWQPVSNQDIHFHMDVFLFRQGKWNLNGTFTSFGSGQGQMNIVDYLQRKRNVKMR